MQVKEALAVAATELGRRTLATELEKPEPYEDDDIRLLLRCFNLVENEIALDYFPLTMRERAEPEGGAIVYSVLSEAPVAIVAVTDGQGKPLPFEARSDRIVLPADTGAVTVEYRYAPRAKTLAEDCSFAGRISSRLLGFGTAAEFCIASGLFAEAAVFDKKYRDALRAAGMVRGNLRLPSRRWV